MNVFSKQDTNFVSDKNEKKDVYQTLSNDIDLKRSSSLCFQGRNLHDKLTIFWTLSAISFNLLQQNSCNFF